MPRRHRSKVLLVILFSLTIGSFIFFQLDYTADQPPEWGITFTSSYATYLGLDWPSTYLAILDELNVSHVRLAAYWNQVEAIRGQYDFADLDWLVDQAADRDRTIVLAVGRRLPRWPECHDPAWLPSLTPDQQRQALFAVITATVERYRDNPAVGAWQVENEPLLRWFGECPPPDRQLLKDEIALVRALDSTRPIITTDSGELSTWLPAARFPDILGTTLYRIVWNQRSGFFDYWFVPPAFYTWKAALTKTLNPSLETVIVTELQMEPWATNTPLPAMTLEEQQRSFDLDRFQSNIRFVTKTGFSPVYLWGVEYWYWLKLQGQPEIWNEAENLW